MRFLDKQGKVPIWGIDIWYDIIEFVSKSIKFEIEEEIEEKTEVQLQVKDDQRVRVKETITKTEVKEMEVPVKKNILAHIRRCGYYSLRVK